MGANLGVKEQHPTIKNVLSKQNPKENSPKPYRSFLLWGIADLIAIADRYVTVPVDGPKTLGDGNNRSSFKYHSTIEPLVYTLQLALGAPRAHQSIVS